MTLAKFMKLYRTMKADDYSGSVDHIITNLYLVLIDFVQNNKAM